MKPEIKIILNFVQGKMTYDEFEAEYSLSPKIWTCIQDMLTPEIMNDPNCQFWTRSNRSALEPNGFSVRAAALAFGFDSQFGRVHAHSLISDLVEFTYPDIRRKSPPEQDPESLLDKLGFHYLGGKETDGVIRNILYAATEYPNAKERNKALKQALREAFHLVPRKVPHWAQSPEWPMGTNSPMAFVGEKQEGERMEYTFRDVDTDTTVSVEQYY